VEFSEIQCLGREEQYYTARKQYYATCGGDVTLRIRDVTSREDNVTMREGKVTLRIRDVTLRECIVTRRIRDVTVREGDMTLCTSDFTPREGSPAAPPTDERKGSAFPRDYQRSEAPPPAGGIASNSLAVGR
jgi:hypothetical protein